MCDICFHLGFSVHSAVYTEEEQWNESSSVYTLEPAQEKSQKFNRSIALFYCFFLSIDVVRHRIFIPPCTGFQFPIISHQQICVLYAICISRNIDTHTHILICIWFWKHAWFTTISNQFNSHTAYSYVSASIVPSYVYHSKIGFDNRHRSEGGDEEETCKNVITMKNDWENRKKEKSVYRHCANGMKQRIHMWSVWVAHIFFRIDFFNHIVNAKKIIIQNEWYWVTICARAEGWKGTQTNQASTAHLNRSNIKRNTHTHTTKQKSLSEFTSFFHRLNLSHSYFPAFFGPEQRWGAYCTSYMRSI